MTLRKLVINGFAITLSIVLVSGCVKNEAEVTTPPLDTQAPVVTIKPENKVEPSVEPTPSEEVISTAIPESGSSELYQSVSVGGLFDVKVAKILPEELSFVVSERNTQEHKVGNFGVLRTISACTSYDFQPMCEQGWVGYVYGDVPLIEAYPDKYWYPDDTPETAIASFVGSDGLTYYVWENPNWFNRGEPLEAFKEDMTQWFVDYNNDPNSLPQIYHPKNIILFE